MFTNRFFTALIVVALAAVVGLTIREAVFTSAVGSGLEEIQRLKQNQAADLARWEAMGEYYARQAQAQRLKEAQPYIMDSATRSYIAWGEALEATRNAEGSALSAYIGNVMNSECRAEIDSDLNVDSATRSYIAWGKALEAKRNAALDSATRSYIAWGQALQAARDAKAIDSATHSYIAWGQALRVQGLMCR